MNPRLIFILVLVIACSASWSVADSARAEVLEVPLDVMTGAVSWDEQQLDFEVGGVLVGLSRVSVRLVGECGDLIYVTCMNMQYAGTWPGILELSLFGTAGEPAIDMISHRFPSGPDAPVNLEWTFDLSAPGALDSLADGIGRLVLTDPASMFDPGSGIFVCPADIVCALESVTLIMEYSLLVGQEASTWGNVKAMYR